MKYIEIAKGTPHNRGIIIPTNKLSAYIGEEPLYRSVYLYDDTAFEYVQDKGSLKNFFGERLLQTGQVQEPSLTMYGQTLGEEKKSAVNATRKSFV